MGEGRRQRGALPPGTKIKTLSCAPCATSVSFRITLRTPRLFILQMLKAAFGDALCSNFLPRNCHSRNALCCDACPVTHTLSYIWKSSAADGWCCWTDLNEFIYLFIHVAAACCFLMQKVNWVLSLILLCGRRWCLLLCESTSASPYKRGAYIRIKLEEAASQPELIRFGRKGTQQKEVNLMQSTYTCTHSGKYVNNLRRWSVPFWCEKREIMFWWLFSTLWGRYSLMQY